MRKVSVYAKSLRFILPFAHFVKGKKSSVYLKELERSQWLSTDEVRRIQWKRLKGMLRHAYENVPLYHRQFRDSDLKPDDIKSASDMLRLPPLTREELRKAVSSGEILARNVGSNRIRENRTGGSTGKPLVFYNDKVQLEYRWASTNRNMRWTGYDIGDRIIKLWSGAQYLDRSASLKERVGNYTWRRKVLSAYHMDESTMEKYVETIKEYQPKLIVGYTSALYLLAKYMEKEGIDDVKVDAVIATAETLFPGYRTIIEDCFNAEVFNRYGSREFSTLAHECEEHSELHMNAENLFIEVVRNGEHAASGERGEILVTDLHNFCMPFIRYRIEDLAIPSDEEKCGCGRGLPLISTVKGRVHSLLVTTEGRYIPGEFFPHLFKDVKGVKQFQVIQEVKDKLLIRIVKGEDYVENETEKALAVTKDYFGENMEILVEHVEEIPPSPSGKRHYTVSQVPIEFT